MNELDMIRTMLDEAPPSAEVFAEGRRRVAGQARRPGSPRARWAVAGAGLTAAAAASVAAVLTVGLTGGAPNAHPGHSAAPSALPPAHFGPGTTKAGVLRNAALAALRLPAGAPAPDQFVYTKVYKQEIHNGQKTVTIEKTWASADGTHFGVSDWGKNNAGAEPACRDGQWWGKTVGMPAENDRRPCSPAEAAAYRPDMPTSPVALHSYLLKLWGFSEVDGDTSGLLINLEYMLTTDYLTPAQRAAVYRLLARTPGLTLVPHVTNVKGHVGVGIRTGVWKGSVYTIIFDRRTYAPLGMNWDGVAGSMKGNHSGEVLLDSAIASNTPPLP